MSPVAGLRWTPVAVLFGVAGHLCQDEPAPPGPIDRVTELELAADDPALVDGRGPTVVSEYAARFDGTLHVWTRSELDLTLRVDDALTANTLASDEHSGGGTTPYVRLDVQRGEQLAILVAGGPDVTGSLTLHLVAAPETDETRAAAAAGREALGEATRLARAGELARARELVAAVGTELANTVGAADSEALGDVLFELGRLAYQLGDVEACHQAWRLAAEHRARTLPADHALLLVAQENLAVSTHASGDLAGARVLREVVLASREKNLPADDPDRLRAQESLAISLHAMGDLARARALREAVLVHYEQSLPANHPTLLRARANLAFSMHVLGDLGGARALREEVLAAYERSLPEDHADLVRARANLAASLHALGDLAGARALREDVLAARQKSLPADHPDLLRARESLAVSIWEMGDLAGARALQEEVLAVYERSLPANHPLLLLARENLAVSLYAMDDLDGARELQQAVLAAREASLDEGHPDLLRARENLAATLWTAGDLDGARALQEEVLAAREARLPEDHPLLLQARENLAATLHLMGELRESRALQEAVLAAFELSLPEDHPELLLARSNLAELMYAMDDLDGVRSLVPLLCAGIRNRVLASLALAPRQATQGVATENYRVSQVLFLSESIAPDQRTSAFELVETVRLVAGESARALARYETDPELAPILSEVASVRRALNDLVAGAAREKTRDTGEFSAELTRLSLKRDRLEREASRRLAERGVVTEPVEAEPLAATLGPGDMAVGYRRIPRWTVNETTGLVEPGADHVLAHVLKSDRTLTRVDLGLAAELEDLVHAWRAAMGAPLRSVAGTSIAAGGSIERRSRGISALARQGDDELGAGRRLRERMLDPVLAAGGEEVRRLFVCLDDLLFLVPLDALPLDSPEASTDGASTGGRVGDRLRIVNEVSFGRLLAGGTPSESPGSLLALGGVDHAGTGLFPDIPESGHEAEAIADLHREVFGDEPLLLTGVRSTKAALFDGAVGKRYLHLATHGWFAPESVRSIADASAAGPGPARMGIEQRITGLAPMTVCGLALAGANRGRDSLGRVPGILTAEELCSLDLSQCELAVLSACETNVGTRRAGQGIQSLQAALHAAGARTSITSLWKVDDAATRRLMELFYTGLWKEKLGKAEALWRAKTALRANGHAVRDWAGWVMTGDPQ